MTTAALYCCDPLKPRRADGHFAVEAGEVRARGGVVGLIDHDALLHGESLRAVERVPHGLLVATDMALRSDGVWRVVEVGDGQSQRHPRVDGSG
jgi:hypothetical protein